MVSHVVVWNGDGCGPMDGINEPIFAVGQGAMVHPDVAPAEDRDAIAVRYGPPPVVLWGVAHHSVSAFLAVVYVDAVDDDVGHVLDGDAWSIGDVHACAPAIDGLERVHDQLLLQLYDHVACEYDPQRLLLDDAVTERPRLRVDGVIVAWLRHDVDFAVPPPDGILAEPNRAIGQLLAILLPVRVAPPAVVDRVPGVAREEPEAPSWGVQFPALGKQCHTLLHKDTMQL